MSETAAIDIPISKPDFVNCQCIEHENISKRFQQLEEQIRQLQPPPEPMHKKGIISFLAENVNSVVGLNEALTMGNRILKGIWAIFIALGIAGTTFYVCQSVEEYLNKEVVTKSALQHSISYAYPPLVICPPWPFDLDHLQSRGLSREALIYSLGYYLLLPQYVDEKWQGQDIQNVLFGHQVNDTLLQRVAHHGKRQFLQFYKEGAYASLSEYFKDIQANISYPGQDDNSTLLFLECNCKEKQSADGRLSYQWSKVVTESDLCYAISLKDVDLMTAQFTSVHIRNRDHTRGLKPERSRSWRVYFTFYTNFDEVPTVMEPYISYAARVNALNIIMLKNDSACVDSTKIGYDQKTCIMKCRNQINFARGLKHRSMVNTDGLDDVQNSFDILGAIITAFLTATSKKSANYTLEEQMEFASVFSNYTAAEAGRSNPSKFLLDLDECYKQCLPPCDRTIYDVYIGRNERFSEDILNESAMYLTMTHSAISQGGIMTLQEIPATTFSEFVSNVGGTLGIFLGCCVMTLAQLVISLVRYSYALFVNSRMRGRSYDIPEQMNSK